MFWYKGSAVLRSSFTLGFTISGLTLDLGQQLLTELYWVTLRFSFLRCSLMRSIPKERMMLTARLEALPVCWLPAERRRAAITGHVEVVVTLGDTCRKELHAHSLCYVLSWNF